MHLTLGLSRSWGRGSNMHPLRPVAAEATRAPNRLSKLILFRGEGRFSQVLARSLHFGGRPSFNPRGEIR